MTAKLIAIEAKFNPGNIAVTRECMLKVPMPYAMTCLEKHLQGDWGTVCEEDGALNDDALENDGRLLSAYPLPNDPGDFWIITEWDRSITTLLLPSDY